MRLSVKVVPRSSRDEILGWVGDVLRVAVTAPPERGRANDAVVSLLARFLGVRRSQVDVLTGFSSPRKLLNIEGMSGSEVRRRLDAIVNS